MKEYIEVYGRLSLGIFIASFLVGVIIGVLLFALQIKDSQISDLKEENDRMYYELIITKDQLTQIQMRNEAIKYIDEIEE